MMQEGVISHCSVSLGFPAASFHMPGSGASWFLATGGLAGLRANDVEELTRPCGQLLRDSSTSRDTRLSCYSVVPMG